MKKITFILAIFLFGAMAYAQDDVLLWNGEGEGLATSVNNWSEDFTVATVSNPVPEGLNTSDNVLSFPAHWFTSEWGDFGGYLCIRGIGAENLGIYTYLTYKFLVIQDDVTTGNSIQTRLKFENGTTDPIDTDQLYTQELTNDGGNEWQQIFIEIPEDVVTTDHVDLCIITSTIDGSDANNHDVEVEMYYDDIGFTMSDEIVSIRELVSENGLSVYTIGNLLNIRMDESAYIDQVEVFDMNGSLVGEKAIESNQKNFNIAIDLQSGVYIIRVKFEHNSFARKFVKL